MSSTKPTRTQREEARAIAERLHQEQQSAEARRQRTILISLLVVGLVVIGGVVAFIFANAGSTTSSTVDVPDLSDAEDPFEGIAAPQGATDDGAIVVGPDGVAGSAEGADADAVTVKVYSDFLCPFCQMFEQTNGPVLEELRAAGDVVSEYHLVSILDRAAAGSQYSTRAAAAAALVADQAPEAFVDLVDALFANQPAEGVAGLTDAQIAELAREAGVAEDVAAQIEDGSYATGEDSFVPWVAAVTEQASRDLPRLATPAVLLDGQDIGEGGLGVDWRVPGALAAAVEQVRG
ncbi:thioredoxin domain-containing protein [Actinotalea sp. Marseille-Q4924]|uniref:DsbA family protein n=1 Tax=Actinotalea sp. Marseille-Q4924 TaxID=2866571 RepID=UPI001CE42BE9|nr:thioredoxin domain-containing protein [Actinotalea sp. Marseille-Q4924]